MPGVGLRFTRARSAHRLAIMGPSGCGKSTLLDTLSGRLGSGAESSGAEALPLPAPALPAFATSKTAGACTHALSPINCRRDPGERPPQPPVVRPQRVRDPGRGAHWDADGESSSWCTVISALLAKRSPEGSGTGGGDLGNGAALFAACARPVCQQPALTARSKSRPAMRVIN